MRENFPNVTSVLSASRPRVDWTPPVLWLFALVLIALILLPLSWLAVYSLTDHARHFTLSNFVTLFSDPDFLDPLVTTAIIAVTSSAICCLVAAPISWLVSRTDMPARRTIRALVTASFVTPPFLGAIAWELLAAEFRPAQPALSRDHRSRSGIGHISLQYLFAAGNHLRDLVLHVPLRLRAGDERARHHAGRTGGRIRDPRRKGVDHGATRHHPARAPRIGGQRSDCVPAGDDAVRLARHSRAASRLSHHDHENLEPFPVSTETRACRGRGGAAAASDHPAAAGAKARSWPPRIFGGWRQIWSAAPHRDEGLAKGGALFA